MTKEVMKMSKAKAPTYKPCQKTPVSGQYGVVGPKGGKTGSEVTVTKGEALPPTPKPSQGFVLVDKTKHKCDKLSLTRAKSSYPCE
jgi:hypothetical protein